MRGKVAGAARALLCVAGALAGSAGNACAQDKEPSDKAVALLMHYAWQLTPVKFVTPDNKTIEVDKTKRESVVVPIENAREIIRVARLTAHAQLCQLDDEQRANFQTLMRREQAKAKWSDQQMLYINQLHLFTVMTLTGQVKADTGDKQFPVLKGELERSGACTEADRKRVQQQVMVYVNANQPPAKAATPPASPKK